MSDHERTTGPMGGDGCEAFGHLASPFVDAELPPAEQQSFATHLDSCTPCSTLISRYRAIDAAAMPAIAPVGEAAWEATWTNVRATIEADRASAAASPLATVTRFTDRLARRPLPRVVRPLLYAAAAAVLFAAVMVIQRQTSPVEGSGEPTTASGTLLPSGGSAARVLSVACATPDYMPVVYTTSGDEPMTVIQCTYVGSET